jgi:hypothetical protein
MNSFLNKYSSYFTDSIFFIDLAALIGITCHTFSLQAIDKQLPTNYINTIMILFVILSAFRLFCILKGKVYISDTIKLLEGFVILYIVQIAMTDPILNTYSYSFEVPSLVTDENTGSYRVVNESKNIYFQTEAILTGSDIQEDVGSVQPNYNNYINYTELMFKYFEYQFLVIAGYVIVSDNSIAKDVDNNTFSLYSLMGKYDSYRLSIALFTAYFTFIIISAFGEKWTYLIELLSLFAALYTTANYRQRRMSYAYVGMFFTFLINIVTNILAVSLYHIF